jgi:hypothetical protein
VATLSIVVKRAAGIGCSLKTNIFTNFYIFLSVLILSCCIYIFVRKFVVDDDPEEDENAESS